MLHAIRFIRLPDSMGINIPQGENFQTTGIDSCFRSFVDLSAAHPAWNAHSTPQHAHRLSLDFRQADNFSHVRCGHLLDIASLGDLELNGSLGLDNKPEVTQFA